MVELRQLVQRVTKERLEANTKFIDALGEDLQLLNLPLMDLWHVSLLVVVVRWANVEEDGLH